jgi:hypothetical protein
MTWFSKTNDLESRPSFNPCNHHQIETTWNGGIPLNINNIYLFRKSRIAVFAAFALMLTACANNVSSSSSSISSSSSSSSISSSSIESSSSSTSSLSSLSSSIPSSSVESSSSSSSSSSSISSSSVESSLSSSSSSSSISSSSVESSLSSSTSSSASPVSVTGIMVGSEGNQMTITILSGTLQMDAVITPNHATNPAVTWSVQNQTGEATITATGLLTAFSDGSVLVKATSISNPSIEGSLVITITNQPAETKFELIAALSDANDNKDSIVISINGDDVLPAKQWVTSMVINTYATAIVNAQVVADLVNATQDDVDNATSTLHAETTTFDEEKSFGVMVIALLELNTAINYAVLAKSGIVSTGISTILGDIGVSPADANSITGFSLNQHPSGNFSKSTQVEGSIYASNDASPTPTYLTQAMTDMQQAYTVGQGITATEVAEIHEGNLGGKTLTNGIYSWSTEVFINTDLTLSGSANDVWIFQIGGSLTQADDVNIILTGGAQAEHIFWLVDEAVSVGAGSILKGNILSLTSIALGINTTIHGRLYAQTVVTLADSHVISPVVEPTEINVQTQDQVLEVNDLGGTLQMSAEVLPQDTSNPSVIWSVANQTGHATINSEGVLTAVNDGTVIVKATSINYPLIFGEITITLTNQVATSKAILIQAVFTANANHDEVLVSVDGTNISPEDVWVTSSVLANYRSTIDDAQSMIDDALATQAQVNTAVTTLANATNIFDGEKAFGTLPEPLGQPVSLGSAGDFAILSKTGVSTTGATSVTGDIGVSPTLGSITGFNLIPDASNTFSTSNVVNGRLYASDDADPTPGYLLTAVSDMETAYHTALEYAPDLTNLHGGDLSGQTMMGGVYHWGTNVLINNHLTLSGNPTDRWIFQISGTLTVTANMSVILTGGALASNIFWIVRDTVAVAANGHVEGTIISQVNITMGAGASVVGRLLALTAVTLVTSSVTKTD